LNSVQRSATLPQVRVPRIRERAVRREPRRRLRSSVSVVAGAALLVLVVGCNQQDETISLAELRDQPALLVVVAEARRATGTGAGDLFVVRPEAAAMETIRAWDSRELTKAGYGAFNAFWAPNRRRIAVTVAYWCSDPCSRIAVIDVRRRSLREITKGGGDHLVRWSKPNELLYHAGVYSRPELSRMTPDGFQRARVRTDLPSMADAIPSPDGQRVARLTRDGSLQLRERGSDRVVTLPRPGRVSGTDIWDQTPLWSPDSTQLLFSRTTSANGDSRSDLYITGPEGSARHIASDETDSFTPMGWSPDGRLILFLRETIGPTERTMSELWVSDADGGRQTRLRLNTTGRSVLWADWGPRLS